MYETRRRKSGRKRVFLRAEPCSEGGDGSFVWFRHFDLFTFAEFKFAEPLGLAGRAGAR